MSVDYVWFWQAVLADYGLPVSEHIVMGRGLVLYMSSHRC